MFCEIRKIQRKQIIKCVNLDRKIKESSRNELKQKNRISSNKQKSGSKLIKTCITQFQLIAPSTSNTTA